MMTPIFFIYILLFLRRILQQVLIVNETIILEAEQGPSRVLGYGIPFLTCNNVSVNLAK